MKRLIALLLAAVMLLSLAACGKGKEPSATPDEATQPTTDTTGETTAPYVAPIGEKEYSKSSYTVADAELLANKDTVVATLGDAKLTVGQLQVYYWMYVYSFLNQYGEYVSLFGLDVTLPLDEQECPETEGSWQQYFLGSALATWQEYQAMTLQGQAENVEMSKELSDELATVEPEMQAAVDEGEYDSLDAMLQTNVGPGIDFTAYMDYLNVYYGGYNYYTHCAEAIEVTDAMAEAYYEANKESLEESGITKTSKLVDVRHILLQPEGGTLNDDGSTTYSDDEWAACEKEANELLDQWKQGEATEESFGKLAEEKTEDPGSQETGGLYQNVKVGDMVVEFEAWCFDESRKPGDTGVVKTSYGYHVMYYSADQLQWLYECRNAALNEELGKIIDNAAAAYEFNVDYDKIQLGYRNLSE